MSRLKLLSILIKSIILFLLGLYIYTNINLLVAIFSLDEIIYSVSIGIGLLFFFSLIFIGLRRERFFYWAISFLLTLIVLPQLTSQRHLLAYEVMNYLNSTEYQCPKSSGMVSSLNFGDGYSSSKTRIDRTKIKVDIEIEEDEVIERPCVGRLKNEPLFHYVKRRIELLNLEYHFNKDRKRLTTLRSMWYRISHFADWEYRAKPEVNRAEVFVFSENEINKTHINKLLLDTSIYKSNLNNTNIKYIELDGSTCEIKAKSYLTGIIEAKVNECRKLNLSKIVKYCYNAFTGSLKESKKNTLDFNFCLEQTEADYAEALLSEYRISSTCNFKKIKQNIRLLCASNESKNSKLSLGQVDNITLTYFDPSQGLVKGVKNLAELLFDYRENLTMDDEIIRTKTGTSLDLFDSYFIDNNEFYFLKMSTILSDSRVSQLNSLKEIK